MKGISLKLKLLLIFALLAFVPVVSAVFYADGLSTQGTKSQLFGTLTGISILVANNYFDYLELNGRSVCSAAEALSEAPPSDWEELLSPLKSMEGVILYAVADSYGKVVANTDPERWDGTWADVGCDISGKAFFEAVRSGEEYKYSESENGTLFYSLPFNDSISTAPKSMVVAFAKPFNATDGGRYYLILISDWYSVSQKRIIVRLNSTFGELGSNIFTPVTVGNQGNHIWADTNENRINSFLPSSAFGNAWSFYTAVSTKRPQALSEMSPDTSEYSLNGQGRFVAVGMAPSWYPYDLGFFAYVTNPEKVYAFSSNMTTQNFMVAAMISLASVFFAFFFARNTSSGISRVTKEAMRVAAGDLRAGTQEVKTKGGVSK